MGTARTGPAGTLLLLACLQAPLFAEVVVVEVGTGGSAERAGLSPGDRLHSWERAGAPAAGGAVLDSPFGLEIVEIEQAPAGPLTLRGSRDGTPLEVELDSTGWLLVTRPGMDPAAEAAYRAAEEKAAAGEAGEAAGELQTLAGRAGRAGRDAEASWLLVKAAGHLLAAGRPEEAEALFRSAEAAAGSDPDLAASVRMAEGRLDDQASRYAEAASAYALALAARGEEPPRDLRTAELLYRRALSLHKAEHLEEAAELHAEALAVRESLVPGTLPVAESLNGLAAAVLFARRDLDEAGALFHRAEAIIEPLAPGGRDHAVTLHGLGLVDWYRGDMEGSEKHLEAALAIRRRLEPGSLEVASTLGSLAGVAWRRSDLEAAEACMAEVLEIRQRLSPGSLDVAKSLNNLGLVVWNRGDLPGATDYYLRSLAIKERLAPGTLTTAMTLNNLGIIALHRGDLAASEGYHLQALAIREAKAPDTLDLSQSFSNLGTLHWQQGDLEEAERFLKQALAIREREAPGGIEVAKDLSTLANLSWKRGDLDSSEAYQRRALAIREEKIPGSLDHADSILGLGRVALARGDLKEAGRLERQALEIRSTLSPDSLAVAGALSDLAELAMAEGRPREALSLHAKALAIRERLAPGSSAVAESAHAMGRLHRDLGEKDRALEMYARAVTALEAQQARLGGVQEVRAEYRARRAAVYRGRVDLLVEAGRAGEALAALEAFRARGLLDQLAERDLVFSRDVPSDLERRRRLLAAEYDRKLEALGELSSTGDAGRIQEIHDELAGLRRRQGELHEEIRKRSPRLAALRHPEPLDLEGISNALDEGTAMLSYSVGRERTLLFALRPGAPLQVHAVPLENEVLAGKVAAFRREIEGGRTGGDTVVLHREARELYRLLVEPAAGILGNADRILVIPDGPLHLLPFAALATGDGTGSWLVEKLPVHVAGSATVYAELKHSRPSGTDHAPRSVMAFGDPRYPAGGASETRAPVMVAMKRSSLQALPATRLEVEAITALFPGSTAFLGAEATEERAKEAGREPDIIHFAAHGLIDSRMPLDSAIALTIPESIEYGRDNGLLQAWEIFESVRIDADLVTLSGCETALGREMAGEGMIGLARSFQYAGARSLLASLWSVSDRSTAALMERFYGGLKKGMPKDEALRAAQLELIRGPGTPGVEASGSRGIRRLASSRETESWSAPFHWAAFQLMGDWR